MIKDIETGSRNRDGRSESQLTVEQQETKDEDLQPIQRSTSLDYGVLVSIDDVLHEGKDEEGKEGDQW